MYSVCICDKKNIYVRPNDDVEILFDMFNDDG